MKSEDGRLIEGWIPVYRRSGTRVQIGATRARLIRRNKKSARYACGIYAWGTVRLDPLRTTFYASEGEAVAEACNRAQEALGRIERERARLIEEAVAIRFAIAKATTT